MKFPSLPISLLRISVAGLFALAVAGVAMACGPDFPNTFLNTPETELLQPPPGSFKAEITRLVPLLSPALPPFKPVQTPGGTGWIEEARAAEQDRAGVLRAEVDDLRSALVARGDTPDQIKTTSEAYANCRAKLEAWNVQQHAAPRYSDTTSKPAPLPELTLPSGLPDEFTRYFQGVVAWDQDKKDDAQKIWTDLLALPAAQRHYRSTWAAYMLARYWAERATTNNAAKSNFTTTAASYARQVRTLAGDGFSDPLGLAEASLGWEAKAVLAQKDYATALNLYFNQFALGDSTALESLRTAAYQAANNASPEQLLALAKDPASRGVLNAFLVTNPNMHPSEPLFSAHWAMALEQANVADQAFADRFAWMAYQGGQFALAQQWATLASEKSAIAEWVRAQLALHAGNLPEGEKHLRGALAADGLSGDQREQAFGELGRACLAQDHPQDALLVWMDGGHEEDASYIAERVLSLDELRAFVDAHCPADGVVPALTAAEIEIRASPHPLSNPSYTGDFGGADLRAEIRYLLARRLARADQVDAAEPYFPDDLRAIFHTYVSNVRLGFDVSQPATNRAAAFWHAAQTARQSGMELLGTELDPDWKYFDDGTYDLFPPIAQDRLDYAHTAAGGVLAPTPDELKRLAASTIPTQRYHYRYRAADLAWWAASLMPNDSEDTAKILNEAGGWLKNRDPLAAQKFYQALVIRCGNTTLGLAAAKAHWFPVIKTQPAGTLP
ncbi:MAG TPA: hypothetical protein VK737_05980 [Opitutales bacterium]|jgi:hypothetical protein|nr:hypothetical protein [Opitutales bacterium]